MRSNTFRRCLWPIAVAGQLAVPAIALAANGDGDPTASSGGLEEIVVTATRRSERLQDVPISVLAFSQEKLDAQGLHNIDDLSRLSPGVALSAQRHELRRNYNDEGSDINIRGVDLDRRHFHHRIYIDDTPIQTRHIGFGSINAFPALFDLDRVEVLRGPQGTLFGAGAEGGVVRFIAPEPDLNKVSGYARADVARSRTAVRRATKAARHWRANHRRCAGVPGQRLFQTRRRLGDRVGYTRSQRCGAQLPHDGLPTAIRPSRMPTGKKPRPHVSRSNGK